MRMSKSWIKHLSLLPIHNSDQESELQPCTSLSLRNLDAVEGICILFVAEITLRNGRGDDGWCGSVFSTDTMLVLACHVKCCL